MKKNKIFFYCVLFLALSNAYVFYKYFSLNQDYNKLLKSFTEYDAKISAQAIAYNKVNKTLNFLINEYDKENYYFLHEIEHPYRESGLNEYILFEKYGLIEKSYFENFYLPDTINHLIIELNDLFIQQKLGVTKNEILLFFSKNSSPPLDTGIFIHDDGFSGYIIVDSLPKFFNVRYSEYLYKKLCIENEKNKSRFVAYIDVYCDGLLLPYVYIKTGGVIDNLFLDIVKKIPKNMVTPAYYNGRKVNNRVIFSI